MLSPKSSPPGSVSSGMKSLFCSTLLWLVVYFACSFVEIVYAEPLLVFSTPEVNSNDITLTCKDDPQSICRFDFYRNGTVWWRVEGNKLDFTVTPQTESTIICTCQSGQSNTLMIATVRNSSGTTMTVNKFREESEVVILECPVVLGSLFGLLDPYEIVWHEIVWQEGKEKGIGIDFLNNMYNRSSDNQLLILPSSISTPREFKCFLRLIRCNIDLCTSITNSAPNMFLLNLIDTYHSETYLTINSNETATLYCGAKGSNISISWSCSGSVNCNDTVEERNSSTMINSTLKLPIYDDASRLINITCTITIDDPMMEAMNTTKVLFTLEVYSSNTTPTTVPVIATTLSLLHPTDRHSVVPVLISIPLVLLSLALLVVVVVIIVVCYRGRKCGKSKKSYSVESNVSAMPSLSLASRKKTPIYEELPWPVYHADHPQLLRQYGIENASNLSKIEVISCHSDEPLCSDVSGLSGVSGNVPGAHKMPMYSTEGSVLDSLQPPQPWAKSHSTFNSTHTQSTILGSNSYYEQQHHPHSCTHSELGFSDSNDHFVVRPRSASQGANSERPYPEEVLYPFYAGSSSCPDHPPPFSNSPLRSYTSAASHASSNSSVHKKALSNSSSRHSSTEHEPSMKYISSKEIISVVDSLKHNRNCEIPGCLCQEFKDRYFELEELALSSNKHTKSHERRVRKSNAVVTSSSTESDSDTADSSGRRARMHLELGKDSDPHMYPHYHLSSKSYIRKSSKCESCECRRRSRSVSDLTPITEIHEICTPKIGGPIVPGTPICHPKSLGIDCNASVAYEAPTKQKLLSSTAMTLLERPRPPLLRQKSISTDNIPVLCLNDCLAKLITPSPSKSYSMSLATVLNTNDTAVPVLKTVHETFNCSESDDSNTSSRSESPPEPEAVKSSRSSSQSDNEEASQASCRNSLKTRASGGRLAESSGYESMEGENSSAVSVFTASSSRRRDSDLKSHARTRMSPVPVSRSSSPFETETKVNLDGNTIMTTEC